MAIIDYRLKIRESGFSNLGASISLMVQKRSESYQQEIKKRKDLFHSAKQGNKAAIKQLKEEYKITSIWNGHAIIRL